MMANAVFFCVLFAATSEMKTMYWTGTGETNGWRFVSLGAPFSDGAARLGAGAQIVSPTWNGMDVLGVDVKLRCSTNAPSRWLEVSFLRNGTVVAGPESVDAPFAPDKAETKSLFARRALRANGVVLSLSTGDVGDWGVYDVQVTSEPTASEPPTDPPGKGRGLMVLIQ